MHWPHAPDNWLFTPGWYFVTAGTYGKVRLLDTPERLTLVRDGLFRILESGGWQLRAWAVLSNHYHLVAHSPEAPETLRGVLAKAHGCSARELNAMDGTPGRRVWYRFMSVPLTYERSLLARLHYTHYNPARHRVVSDARQYAWCSAAWFDRSAPQGFVRTIERLKSDALADEF